MSNKNLFVGIDLGTTNSVICFGAINPNSNDVEPKIIPIDMMISGGGKERRELLSSCVYFRENGPPIVGDYAKAMIGRQTERVVKSVKNFMGSDKNFSFPFDNKVYTPSDISALILKTLAIDGAKKILGFVPEDVIITVPASFDSDQRSATIEAARIAGFKTTHPDGSPKNILLDEPRAALYDFLNKHKRREIPSVLIDFQTPKVVLVFDLGGGTLDVSLHKVFFDEKNKDMQIEDYAVSRYTQIGGDNFDSTLADFLLKEYEDTKKIQLDKLDEIKRHALRIQFIQYAENAKIDLSNEIDNAINNERNIEDVSIEILQTPYDNKTFEYMLNLKKYEEIIKDWLGWGLTKNDISKIDEIQNRNNIIYPILDVLSKAFEKLKFMPVVDAILLNGGMTRLYSVRNRLKDFFGIEPIVAGDPDKAVARGATIFHYQQTMGIKTTTILNDTIGIGIHGGYVSHLAQAGSVLPYKSKTFEFVVAQNGATFIDLPFYMGRRNDTQLPNRRIANRHIKFSEPLQEGDPIALRIEVDSMQIITLEGWCPKNPSIKFSVIVNSHNQEKEEVKVLSPAQGFAKKNIPKSALPANTPPINPKETLDEFEVSCENWTHTYRDSQQKSYLMKRIREVERNIFNASNREDFIPYLIQYSKENGIELFINRVLILLGRLSNICSESMKEQICDFCLELSNPKKLDLCSNEYIQQTLRYTVETIGKCGLKNVESKLLALLENKKTFPIFNSLIYAIGKCCRTASSVRNIRRFINDNIVGHRIAVNWSLGKMGSREQEYPLDIICFQEVITNLYSRFLAEQHIDAKRNAIYAFGEICDRRNPNVSIVSETQARRIIDLLSARILRSPYLEERERLGKIAQAAINMISGIVLSQEQSESLLAIRTELDISTSEE